MQTDTCLSANKSEFKKRYPIATQGQKQKVIQKMIKKKKEKKSDARMILFCLELNTQHQN